MADRRSRWPRYPRDVDGAWLAIEDLRDAVDGISVHERIENAVTDALATHDRRNEVRSATVFNRREKIAVLAVAVIVAVPSFVDLLLRWVP